MIESMEVSSGDCSPVLDLYVKEMEDRCPSLIAENMKKNVVGENRVLEAEE